MDTDATINAPDDDTESLSDANVEGEPDDNVSSDDDTDATGYSSTDSCDESDDATYADANESESVVAAPLENESNGATFKFYGHNVLDGSNNEIIAKKDPYDY